MQHLGSGALGFWETGNAKSTPGPPVHRCLFGIAKSTAQGGLRGVLGVAGTALEAYKRCVGGSQGRLGAVLGSLEAMLEPSRSQKAPKIEPKRVPNRAPEATRAENDETLIFIDSTKDSNIFSSLRASFSFSK